MNSLRFYGVITWEVLLNLGGLFRVRRLPLLEVRPEGENIKTFIFGKPKSLQFEAGQYGLWALPQWVWGKPVRLFTIAASPTEDTVQISTRVGPSDFKQKLNQLPIGKKIYLFGPFGRFTLGKNPPAEAVLIAGGIGATPMRAISKFAHDTKLPTKLTLIHSAAGYYLYQKESQQNIPNCRFVTKETFSAALKAVAAKTDAQTPFYLSGPPAFVTFAEASLRDLHKNNIKKDGFLGY